MSLNTEAHMEQPKTYLEQFGRDRVIDTPISEASHGWCQQVGAAMTGLRPIAELMYVDFFGMSMDQIGKSAQQK